MLGSKNGSTGSARTGPFVYSATIEDLLIPHRMGHELRPQIMELISHLISHDQYSAAFESFYVDTTKAYYKEESTRMAKEMKSDPAGFTIHCISRVKEEVQRADEMLSEATCSLVRATVESALVENRVAWVASQGMPISSCNPV